MNSNIIKASAYRCAPHLDDFIQLVKFIFMQKNTGILDILENIKMICLIDSHYFGNPIQNMISLLQLQILYQQKPVVSI